MFYFQGDHLGSSSVVMTSGGTLNTRQTYYPFGTQRTTEGSAFPTGMDYTFTGQKSDDSTGLMFYGARYYDVSLGRFTQPDTIVPNPLNPQSLNRFSYTLNNPVRYVDPSGHMACTDDCGLGGGGGDPNEDPCYPDGCVIFPLPGGGLGEKNNNDGSVITLPAEPQKPPVAQCPHPDFCTFANGLYDAGKIMDTVSLLFGLGEEGFIFAAFLLSLPTGPQDAIAAWLIANAFMNATFRNINRALAFGSFSATSLGDAFSGETRLDFTKREFVLGANTMNSAIPTAVTIFSPINEFAVLASAWQVTVVDFPIVKDLNIPFLSPLVGNAYFHDPFTIHW